MNRNVRKLLALALALCLCLCLCLCVQGAAMAEEDASLTAAQPLIDLTASAALRVGEEAERIAPDGVLSQAFVQNFFLLGQQADPALGISGQLLTDTAAQEDYLRHSFVCGGAAAGTLQENATSFDYVGVRVMVVDESEDGSAMRVMGDLYQANRALAGMTEAEYAAVRWLDRRAVIDLRRSADAPCGWQVYAFSLEAELEMETAAQDYFTKTMTEYMNPELGFSLQYPAVFGEDCVRETASGVEGSLQDGTASFLAERTSNDAAWTLETLMAQKKQENPAAETNINEVSGCGRQLTALEGGGTRMDLYIVTEAWVYHAQLCFDASLTKDFALYIDYMMNSFMADELGLG